MLSVLEHVALRKVRWQLLLGAVVILIDRLGLANSDLFFCGWKRFVRLPFGKLGLFSVLCLNDRVFIFLFIA